MPSCTLTIRTPLVIQDGEPQFNIEFDATKRVYSIPDVLGVYGETLVGLRRGGRDVPKFPAGDRELDKCWACDDEEGCSVNNPRPFGPLVHKVLFVPTTKFGMKHDVKEIRAADLHLLYNEAYRITKEAKERHGNALDGVAYGMNCGEYVLCGETQPHIHSQLAGLPPGSENAADRLGALCENWHKQEDGASYLDAYLKALRRKVRVGEKDGVPVSDPHGAATESSLIIDENKDAVLVVPVSQRFRGSMQIIVKHEGMGNLLQTTDDIRHSIAKLEHRAIMACCLLGYTAFNCISYATRFSADTPYDQRFIVNIYPRSGIIALSELLGRYVCDEMPWKSAMCIRDAIGLPDVA